MYEPYEPNRVRVPPPTPDYKFNPSLSSYYKFHRTGRTWDEARRICQEEGSHLAVVNSEQEAKFLANFLSDPSRQINVQHTDQVSIGFHDRFIKGEYLTVLGKRPRGKESTELRITQNKGKESENSYQKLKSSQWRGTGNHTVTKSKYFDGHGRLSQSENLLCLSTVIFSIFGKSFHFPFPYFVLVLDKT